MDKLETLMTMTMALDALRKSHPISPVSDRGKLRRHNVAISRLRLAVETLTNEVEKETRQKHWFNY